MKVTDLELMLFHDGELEAEGARRVRVARLTRADVSGRLAGIGQVGDFVRALAEARGIDPNVARREAAQGRRRRRAFGAVMLALAAGAVLGVPEAPRHAEAAPAVAIEAVDFGSRTGTVFLVEAGETQTAVVWLSDDARLAGEEEQAKLGTL